MTVHSRVAAVVLAIASPSSVAAQATPDPQVDHSLSAYAKPQRMVRLPDGRKIHLMCIGRGAPTVILAAGLANWSSTWRKVHAPLGKITRTCSWDRAGFGHSDPSREPQDAEHTVSDLTKALRAAGIGGPYVMVGHSLGAAEAQLFAARNPRSVVGMVLVDPWTPDMMARFAAVSPAYHAHFSALVEKGREQLRQCIASAAGDTIEPGSQAYAKCVRPPQQSWPADFVAFAQKQATSVARLKNAVSLADNAFGATGPQVAAAQVRWRTLPLVVLSATERPVPSNLQADGKLVHSELLRIHANLAGLSKRGSHRQVAGADHFIQLSRPEAVIAAVTEIVRASRKRR